MTTPMTDYHCPEHGLLATNQLHFDGHRCVCGRPAVHRQSRAEVLEALQEGRGPGYDLIGHMIRQIAFSTRAFGPEERQQGVVDHIRKELREIEEAPHDLEEWIDVVLLGLDGAWRAGHTAVDVAAALEAKLTKNENRTWPDWRTADSTKAIEHDRTED